MRRSDDPSIRHICTSTSAGQALVRDSIRELCRALPGIAGIIDISASEYSTHCWSHADGGDCPRCSKRRPADVVVELLGLMQQGIEASGKEVELIAHNWSWHFALADHPAERGNDILDRTLAPDARRYLLRKLPPEVAVLLNFEYGAPVRRGGTLNHIWEYSMSRSRQGPLTAVQKRTTLAA